VRSETGLGAEEAPAAEPVLAPDLEERAPAARV